MSSQEKINNVDDCLFLYNIAEIHYFKKTVKAMKLIHKQDDHTVVVSELDTRIKKELFDYYSECIKSNSVDLTNVKIIQLYQEPDLEVLRSQKCQEKHHIAEQFIQTNFNNSKQKMSVHDQMNLLRKLVLRIAEKTGVTDNKEYKELKTFDAKLTDFINNCYAVTNSKIKQASTAEEIDDINVNDMIKIYNDSFK